MASVLLERGEYGKHELELFGVVVGMVICSSITAPLTALAGFARNEPLSTEAMIFGAAGGVLVAVFGTIAWRKANLITHDLTINVVAYLTPVFALAWLLALGLVGEVSIWHAGHWRLRRSQTRRDRGG